MAGVGVEALYSWQIATGCELVADPRKTVGMGRARRVFRRHIVLSCASGQQCHLSSSHVSAAFPTHTPGKRMR